MPGRVPCQLWLTGKPSAAPFFTTIGNSQCSHHSVTPMSGRCRASLDVLAASQQAAGRGRSRCPTLGGSLAWAGRISKPEEMVPIFKQLLLADKLPLTMRKQILCTLVLLPSEEVRFPLHTL